jgi:DNA mismatch repair protein MutS2
MLPVSQEREGRDAALGLIEFPRVREWLAGYTVSPHARALAQALVPSAEAVEVEAALCALREAKALHERRGPWPLPPAADVGASLALAERGQLLDAPALGGIGALLAAIESAARYWRAAAAETPHAAVPAARLVPQPELARLLARSIGPEGEVLDSASAQLARLRQRAAGTRREMMSRLERLASRAGELSDGDSVVTQRDGRFVVSVRADRFDRSRGVVHDSSRSGAMLYVEPFSVVPLNNELRETEAAVRDEIQRILAALRDEVAAAAGPIRDGHEALAAFDLLHARVRLSRALRGTTADLTSGESASLRLQRARHPLLWRQAGGDRDPEAAAGAVVPFDLDLGQGVRTLLVSGPNMGGKSVLLKAVGLAIAMSHAGLDVCAGEGSRVPFVRGLHADIGDAQSLDDHLSTFAARLSRMNRMSASAGPECLCVLDEIGSGTDPEEGAALARALLEHLGDRRTWVVATTHLGALKSLGAERPEVRNASMEIDVETLTPRYRLLAGVPGRSYGVATAERLGFDAAVLGRARELMRSGATSLEALIEQLGRELAAARAERVSLARALAEAERRSIAWTEEESRERERWRWRENRRLEELAALEGQARALLRAAHREAERAAEERDRDALQRLRGDARVLAAEVDAARRQSREAAHRPLDPAAVTPGITVFHPGLEASAQVVEGPTAEGTVVLARGSLRITARLSDLRAAAPAAPVDSGASRSLRMPSFSAPERDEGSLEIDVRGRPPDEAIDEVDRALDRAVLAGQRELRVIHGIGKGVLRSAIVRHLAGHPQVRAHRLGAHGEGGRGATVVELA